MIGRLGIPVVAVALAVALCGPASAEVLVDFPTPSMDSSPAEITAGSDGALWFAESGKNAMARVTTAGSVTEFPLPPPPPGGDSGPQGVTLGPDGNVWFTNTHSDLIGRITPAGNIAQ